MMRALTKEVAGAVFETIKHLLPERPEHPLGCHRPRIPDEICFRGILLRAVTGSAWTTIECALGFIVSDTTLRARRDEWIAAGVFDRLMAQAHCAYDKIVGLDTTHVVIDGSHHPAPSGGEGTGIPPAHKGRLGWKWSLAVDADGIPLAWTLDGGNRNDYAMLTPTLDLITQGPNGRRIGTLHLDRGYGYKSLPDRLDGYPIDHLDVVWRNQPGQGRVPLVGFGRRWIVERTHSWFTNFGQLSRNTDRKTAHRDAALCLAAALIITAKLIDHRNQRHRPIR